MVMEMIVKTPDNESREQTVDVELRSAIVFCARQFEEGTNGS